MGKISLRTYNREISTLIERGENEEAIAHCKYILKQYPKHIDTYRLLGKAFLEAQRYTEASDILQRVLSVIPDDFVGHLGMSIIREDEGNLDAAIWHMERAFETQPSNSAVQEELRRLFGRRDGAEPHKIRLTRGALVRMYTRGELYNQAVAEARVALQEDPNRMDLMVMMARNYTLQNNKVDAVETATQIISRLPFCYEANRILAQILPGTARAEDARTYQQRIFSLDPYAAFLSPANPTGDQVPENAVSLERLDYHPGQKEVSQPGWAQTVGVHLDETEDALPDWLDAIPTGQPQAEVAGEAVDEDDPAGALLSDLAAEKEAAPIPEWMQAAGWVKTDQPEVETHLEAEPAPALETSLEAPNEEAVMADIPDWLKEIAPQDQQEDHLDDVFRTSLLEQILPTSPEQTGTSAVPQPEAAAPETPAPTESKEDLPGWLAEKLDETVVTAGQSSEELPAWLQELDGINTVEMPLKESTGSEGETVTPDASAELPGWLKEMESGLAETGSDESDLPDWLKSAPIPADSAATEDDWLSKEPAQDAVQSETPAWLQDLEQSEQLKQEADLPDWLQQINQESQTVSPGVAEKPESTLEQSPIDSSDTVSTTFVEQAAAPQEQTPPVSAAPDADTTPESSANLEDALAWLESLAVRQGVDEETLITDPNQRASETPEWISALETPFETRPEAAASGPTVEDMLAGLESMTEPTTGEEEPLPTLEADDLISDGEQTGALPSLEDRQDMDNVVADKTSLMETPAIEMMETVELVSEAHQETGEPTGAEELSAMPLASAAEQSSDEMPGEDDAFAWLESLARQQGAEEETLIAASETDAEIAPPAWLQGLEEDQPVAAQTEPQGLSALPAEEASAEIPAWLQDVEEASEPIATETIELPAEPETILETRPETPVDLAPIASVVEEAAPDASLEDEPLPMISEMEETPVEPVEDTQPVHVTLPEIVAEEKPELVIPTGIPQEMVNSWIRDLGSEPTEQAGAILANERLDSPQTEPVYTGPVETVSEPDIEVQVDEKPLEAGLSQSEAELDLTKAREFLEAGKLEEALPSYQQWIESGQNIPQVIEDLEKAIYRHPIDIDLWQLLGDAFMQDNQIQKALDAYTKAEELIR